MCMLVACAPGSPPIPQSCRCRPGPLMLARSPGPRGERQPLHYRAIAMPQFPILKTYFKVKAEGFAKTSAAFYK